MSNELVMKAKARDCEAFKKLLNQSLSNQGISVKSVSIDDGLMNIELRSIKGQIEPQILDQVKSKTEKLGIQSVYDIQVYQYQYQKSSSSNKSSTSSGGDNLIGLPIHFVNQVYKSDLMLKNLGIVLFLLGCILMLIGFFYDPSYGDSYNIGAISFKQAYTNTGGFISICGAIFIASSRGGLAR